MIGLVGAHRTGKTTLAKAFADATGVPFVQTRSSQVFERLGLDPAAPMDFDTRLSVQHELLNDAETLWSENRAFITDRTPLDMLTYTYGDVSNGSLNPLQERALGDYDRRCIRLAERHFDILLLIQPGIAIEPAPGKASLSQGYIEHLNAVAAGLMLRDLDVRQRAYLPRDCLDLQRRLHTLKSIYVSHNYELTVTALAERGNQAVH